ncbi:unannotated protein [freshwater metagenome]|uniref:Unannotated protein n=1 Tax=freshwater metagenome TaxID=449393 RepID=A0A6J7SFX7_9ZZZZ
MIGVVGRVVCGPCGLIEEALGGEVGVGDPRDGLESGVGGVDWQVCSQVPLVGRSQCRACCGNVITQDAVTADRVR